MTIASGVIPYNYEGPYPFRVPNNHSIGFSGILFEQAMTVHTAEMFRFGGSTNSPPTFNKYFNLDSPVEEFTPLPDGHNLDGRVNGVPAGAFFIDYLLDLRSSLSTVNAFASFDLGGSTIVFLKDWLLWVGSTSGTRANFTRVEFPLGSDTGLILSTDFDDLGASGVIADIDLREVSYQPYSRMSSTRTTSYRLTTIQLGSIFPGFMSTNGVFVNLNSREQSLSFTSQGTTRTSDDFQAGLMILDGDMFFTDTDFCLVPGTATRDNLEGVITHNAYSPPLSLPGRIFFGNVDNTVDPRASAIVSPIALSPGGYGVGAINSLSTHPKLVVPSGTLSFKPAIPYDGDHAGSGFYVFDQTFWIQDDEILNPSGLRLLNPLTRSSFVWFRIADQANIFDDDGISHAWNSQTTVGLMDDGINYIKMATLFAPADADTKMGFFLYDKNTLDLSSVVQPTQDWTVFTASISIPGNLKHASYDGTLYYAYTNSGSGPARNIFLFDSSFILTDSKFYGDRVLSWIQGNIFTGGVFAASEALFAEETIYELIIDPDTGNDIVTDTGIAYTVDVSVAAWPASHTSLVIKVYPPKNITGSPHFTNGTWMLATNTDGVTIMFRGELSGSSIVPQEGFVLSMLGTAVSSRAGYEFVHGTFT